MTAEATAAPTPGPGAAFKDEGNVHFKAQEFLKAAASYTKAIKAEPGNHVFYSNRSQAFLKLSKVQKALEDAEKCIESMTAGGYSKYELSNSTEVAVTTASGNRTTFTATQPGNGADNPDDPLQPLVEEVVLCELDVHVEHVDGARHAVALEQRVQRVPVPQWLLVAEAEEVVRSCLPPHRQREMVSPTDMQREERAAAEQRACDEAGRGDVQPRGFGWGAGGDADGRAVRRVGRGGGDARSHANPARRVGEVSRSAARLGREDGTPGRRRGGGRRRRRAREHRHVGSARRGVRLHAVPRSPDDDRPVAFYYPPFFWERRAFLV